jgi:hypothetical protein
MHLNDVIRGKDLVQLSREVVIDTQIAAQIPARELGEVDTVVQYRPEYAIGEAIVVFVVIFSGEIERDVGYLIVHDLLCGNLSMRSNLSTPAEPSARFVLKRGLDGNFKPARARVYIFLGNADSIRDYDELSQ